MRPALRRFAATRAGYGRSVGRLAALLAAVLALLAAGCGGDDGGGGGGAGWRAALATAVAALKARAFTAWAMPGSWQARAGPGVGGRCSTPRAPTNNCPNPPQPGRNAYAPATATASLWETR